ncbi:hypothetical protein ACN2XU_10220 [Primorskyibacter sp. 2E107]|uniref:hypothetical protein n=1 Tax=Primorskyibacter sp. 2E107 TaxID=3403458 RepID=UPI003AF9A1D4
MSEKPRPHGAFDMEEPGVTPVPDVADLARGANGLGEPYEPDALARGILDAQFHAAQAMLTASMSLTTGSLRAIAAFWGAGSPRDRKDDG